MNQYELYEWRRGLGYTHYWRSSNDCPIDIWVHILADAKALITASPVKLTYEEENDVPPVVEGDLIRFNGFEDGCETFILRRSAKEFDFCKTRGRGYDHAVVGILACAADRAPDWISVSSDGDERDWRDGLAWASSVLNRSLIKPNRKTDA